MTLAMIDTERDMKRRMLAMNTAQGIVSHPNFPYQGEWPRAMIAAIEEALKTWEEQTNVLG